MPDTLLVIAESKKKFEQWIMLYGLAISNCHLVPIYKESELGEYKKGTCCTALYDPPWLDDGVIEGYNLVSRKRIEGMIEKRGLKKNRDLIPLS